MGECRRLKVLAIIGPTAGGKSDLAMALSDHLPVEIVCMDSMQVYRGLDIGTAKPSQSDRARVPHHMVDVCAPEQSYSVAEYVQGADACIQAIAARRRVPVLVGGTGLYLRAMRYPMTLGNSARDDEVRGVYQRMLEQEGPEAVHAVLAKKDPETARQLHPNNTRRVIRALEVLAVTGHKFSEQTMPQENDQRYDMRIYATQWDRETLYRRIDARVTRMVDAGLFEEVRGLLSRGVPRDAQSMQGLGYKEAIPFLGGQATLANTVERISRRTRNYAKRQMTWFRREKGVSWLAMEAGSQQARATDIAAQWGRI